MRRRAAAALLPVGVLLAGLGAAILATHWTGVEGAPAPTAATSVSSAPSHARTSPPSPRPTTAAPPASPVGLPASPPVRVAIPAIGVDSELMALGLLPDGTLEVPPGAFPAGWFTGAPTPGEIGPAIIVGHIDWVTGPGVFADLGSLTVDAEIHVARADDTVVVFRVTEVARYAKDAFPTERVYGDLDHPGLRVISCGGAFNRRTGHYEDNIVVYADVVG